ncbi:endonuclease domain-containing protein [Pseudonocardia acidicola]|uniref:DUF559 domain-containing protein n=1 Tax=Pseudonocardia acidicola TaxID=2724939 RepID=A0ABX1SKQ0_9PSEU|nr:DUF559 domain-containing protein [Pseudonocardia acidicola]NMI02126.1 DUF559 domain-containing protein [Pseudonocardia acidicola]
MSVNSYLLRQAGVITRAQACSAGLSRDAVDRRLATRRWRPVHPRVYLAAGHRLTDEARVRAAVLWAGEGAVLSGAAAAWWHEMAECAPPVVGVTVPRRRCPGPRPGVTVRRRGLDPADGDERNGVIVTARPLTVLEAAVEMGGAGGAFLDRALQRWVRFPAVYEAYCRNLGAYGSASARRLLVAAADGSASVAGRLLQRMLRDAGIRGWRAGHDSGGFVIGVAFPAARVAIEVDGWAWHMDAERTRQATGRRNALARQGWAVLRYTWHDLVEQPRVVLAEIVHAVAAARWGSS